MARRRRGGLLGALARLAGRPPEPPPAPEVVELLPDPGPSPGPEPDPDAAEVTRRLEEARERLRAATPPREDSES